MRIADAFVPPINYSCKVEDVLFRNVARNCEIVGNIFSFETDIFVRLDEKKSRKYTVHFVIKDNKKITSSHDVTKTIKHLGLHAAVVDLSKEAALVEELYPMIGMVSYYFQAEPLATYVAQVDALMTLKNIYFYYIHIEICQVYRYSIRYREMYTHRTQLHLPQVHSSCLVVLVSIRTSILEEIKKFFQPKIHQI